MHAYPGTPHSPASVVPACLPPGPLSPPDAYPGKDWIRWAQNKPTRTSAHLFMTEVQNSSAERLDMLPAGGAGVFHHTEVG